MFRYPRALLLTAALTAAAPAVLGAADGPEASGLRPVTCDHLLFSSCVAAGGARNTTCHSCCDLLQLTAGAQCSAATCKRFCAEKPDPSYDHQTKPYVANHRAVTVQPTPQDPVLITPFFSPTDPSKVLVELIDSANDTIDIGTPGFSSWSRCTPYADNVTCAKACSPEMQRGEKFPIFPAIVNAVQRGVRIRILTNSYNVPDCPGTISPLPFLALNGVDVAYYTSTTFYHAKYIAVDGKRASVSSINFSRTSFTRNREAGALIEGAGAAPLLSMLAATFNDDWSQSRKFKAKTSDWSKADLAVITNKTLLPVVMPSPSPTWAKYWNPPTPTTVALSGSSRCHTPQKGSLNPACPSVMATTSPDFAASALLADIDRASHSIDIMIYQITGSTLVDRLLRLSKAGVKVRLLVSSSIYGAADCALANQAYENITTKSDPPISIYKTSAHYEYSHQKFWIVDEDNVGWSTGNWGNSDFPTNSNTTKQVTYPPYKRGNGWQKLNRDYTMYVSGSLKVATLFRAVFDGDSDYEDKFPSKVYKWTPKYPVKCGSGV